MRQSTVESLRTTHELQALCRWMPRKRRVKVRSTFASFLMIPGRYKWSILHDVETVGVDPATCSLRSVWTFSKDIHSLTSFRTQRQGEWFKIILESMCILVFISFSRCLRMRAQKGSFTSLWTVQPCFGSLARMALVRVDFMSSRTLAHVCVVEYFRRIADWR